MSGIKTDAQREQEAIKHIIATIFSAQDALRDLAPQQRWVGMGNLLGDYGEYIALANYNFKKAPSGADGYDAVTIDCLKVQIKANYSSSTIGFRGEADLLLVLKIESNARVERILLWTLQTSQGESNILETRQQVHDPSSEAQGSSQSREIAFAHQTNLMLGWPDSWNLQQPFKIMLHYFCSKVQTI